MIYAIVGRPGGGKTYEAVAYHIIPAIKDGRKVITNITLNIDWFVKVFGEDVRELIKIVDGRLTDFGSTSRPFSQIEDYSDEWRNEKGQGPLYVVDEAHMSLPSRGLAAPILARMVLNTPSLRCRYHLAYTEHPQSASRH
ncbi:TPA: zonular occludens toxin domain-containing protein [Vibrio diabolicus]